MNQSWDNIEKLKAELQGKGYIASNVSYLPGRGIRVEHHASVAYAFVHFGRRGQIKWITGNVAEMVASVARAIGIRVGQVAPEGIK